MKKVNVNKNCDMKANDLNVSDNVILLGLQCKVVNRAIFVEGWNIKWDGKDDNHTFTDLQINIMLSNGMEVWREVEPKKHVYQTNMVADGGYLRPSSNTLGFGQPFEVGDFVKITIEEVLD